MVKGVKLMAWLSILGMYNYDESVFDGFRTPENVDKETTIQNILLECAELEIIYPEFETMKTAIKLWTDKEFAIWEELQKTREYDYNPIWNKDGIIRETEDHENNRNVSGSSTITGRTTTNESGTGEDIRSVQGFNERTWAEAEKNENSASRDATVDDSNQSNVSSNEEDTGRITRERVEQGNIGVTTTQKMIQEQRDIVVFNTMEYILSSFKKRFCIMVY